MVKSKKGFTLVEVMIVVAIVAIIMAFALPAYQDYVIKSNRAVGRAELVEVSARLEQYFTDNKEYVNTVSGTDLTALGYPASPYFLSDRGEPSSSSTDAIYSIGFSASAANSFTLQAIPQNRQVDDSKCGTLSYSNLGVKGETGTGDVNDCW